MKERVLIIDDEPSTLSIMAHILEKDYQVQAVDSGRKALEILSSRTPPDIILMDIMMPDWDGYSTIRKIKEEPGCGDIPVIFISTLDSDTDEEYGFKLGAVDFINKPVKPALVHARIHSQLELKKHRDRLKNQNHWLEEEVRRQVESNLLLQEASLATLVGLVETRDSDTGNHILRTQYYVETLTTAVASQWPCGDEACRERAILIPKASQLHDIGKIGIPDSILLKKGALTPEEMAVMESHARIGGDILAKALKRTIHRPDDGSREEDSLEFLEVARVIATYHHEKWDGTGYPAGLKKSAIPLPARIMAVADVFDALTTRRIYKEPISTDDAFQIIRDERETHFDPLLIEAFEDNYENFTHIFRLFRDDAPA